MARYIFPNVPSQFSNGDQIFFRYTGDVQAFSLAKYPIKRMKIQCYGGQCHQRSGAGYAEGILDITSAPSLDTLYVVVGRGARNPGYSAGQRRGNGNSIYLPHSVDNVDFEQLSSDFDSFGGGHGMGSAGSTDVRTYYNATESPDKYNKAIMSQKSLESVIIGARGKNCSKGVTENKINANYIQNGVSKEAVAPAENGLVVITVMDTLQRAGVTLCFKKSGTSNIQEVSTYNDIATSLSKVYGKKKSGVTGMSLATPEEKISNAIATIGSSGQKFAYPSSVVASTDFSSDNSLGVQSTRGTIRMHDRDVIKFPKGVTGVKATCYFKNNTGRTTSYTETKYFRVNDGYIYIGAFQWYEYFFWFDATEHFLINNQGWIFASGRSYPSGRNGGIWKVINYIDFEYSPEINAATINSQILAPDAPV